MAAWKDPRSQPCQVGTGYHPEHLGSDSKTFKFCHVLLGHDYEQDPGQPSWNKQAAGRGREVTSLGWEKLRAMAHDPEAAHDPA